MRYTVLAACTALLVACESRSGTNCPTVDFSDTSPDCPSVYSRNITGYCYGEVFAVTASGIRVDDSGFDVDYDQLDGHIDALEQCLGVSIDRTCLRVKIAPDWFEMPCEHTRGRQVFPCELGPADEKTRDRRGTCEERAYFDPNRLYCTGAVQDGHVMVVTPNLRTVRHEGIHVVRRTPDHQHPAFRCE